MNFRTLFNIMLTSWLLAIGIDGFYGGVTAGQVGATISLIGGVTSFLLLCVSFAGRSPRDKS